MPDAYGQKGANGYDDSCEIHGRLFDALCYTLQDVVEYLWCVSLGDEVALELRRTDVDAATEHVAEVAGKALLVGALCVLEIAHRIFVEE